MPVWFQVHHVPSGFHPSTLSSPFMWLPSFPVMTEFVSTLTKWSCWWNAQCTLFFNIHTCHPLALNNFKNLFLLCSEWFFPHFNHCFKLILFRTCFLPSYLETFSPGLIPAGTPAWRQVAPWLPQVYAFTWGCTCQSRGVALFLMCTEIFHGPAGPWLVICKNASTHIISQIMRMVMNQ